MSFLLFCFSFRCMLEKFFSKYFSVNFIAGNQNQISNSDMHYQFLLIWIVKSTHTSSQDIKWINIYKRLLIKHDHFSNVGLVSFHKMVHFNMIYIEATLQKWSKLKSFSIIPYEEMFVIFYEYFIFDHSVYWIILISLNLSSHSIRFILFYNVKYCVLFTDIFHCSVYAVKYDTNIMTDLSP